MDLPISRFLKRREEIKIALLEDEIVAIMLNITDKIALHGGTAVWRCYGGKRFSTDIDVYAWDKNFKEKFISAIKDRGAEVTKFKGGTVSFIRVKKDKVEIKVESRNLEKRAIMMPYEKFDGSKINVLVLSPEDLILEKIEAYLDRRAYKDLYDITVLLNNVNNYDKIKRPLSEFAKDIPMPDESVQSFTEFKATVYAGLIPTFEKMAEFVKRWSK